MCNYPEKSIKTLGCFDCWGVRWGGNLPSFLPSGPDQIAGARLWTRGGAQGSLGLAWALRRGRAGRGPTVRRGCRCLGATSGRCQRLEGTPSRAAHGHRLPGGEERPASRPANGNAAEAHYLITRHGHWLRAPGGWAPGSAFGDLLEVAGAFWEGPRGPGRGEGRRWAGARG